MVRTSLHNLMSNLRRSCQQILRWPLAKYVAGATMTSTEVNRCEKFLTFEINLSRLIHPERRVVGMMSPISYVYVLAKLLLH